MKVSSALLVLSTALLEVLGHGYLTFPVARRLDERRSSYTGDTAFGAGDHITNCGKKGLSTPDPVDVVTDLTRGTIMKFQIDIHAHHAGHLELRLCHFQITSDDQDITSCTLLKRATAAEARVTGCSDSDGRDICGAVDPINPAWWYLAPKNGMEKTHEMWFHIPTNVNCASDRCTVQFTWKTANSCNPHPKSYCNYYHKVPGPQKTWCKNWYCGSKCTSGSGEADNCEATMGNRNCCSEVFTNCAEVRLLGAYDGSAPPPSPTPAPNPAPTPAPPVACVKKWKAAPGASVSDGQCNCDTNKWWPCSLGPSYCVHECDGGAPAPGPAPAPTPAPTGGPPVAPLDCSECKKKCSDACSYNNGRNQCWGSPRYIECTCSDGSQHSIPGCECDPSRSDCPNVPAPAPQPVPQPSPPQPSPPQPRPQPRPQPPTPEPEPEPETCVDKVLAGKLSGFTCADFSLAACMNQPLIAAACCGCKASADAATSLPQIAQGVRKLVEVDAHAGVHDMKGDLPIHATKFSKHISADLA